MGNISVSYGELRSELSGIEAAGTSLGGTRDGIKQTPGDVEGLPTPPQIAQAYAELSELIAEYGQLMVHDAKRIQVVGNNKVTIDALASQGR